MPVIIGGSAAEAYSFVNGSVSGRVVQTSDREVPVSDATVVVTYGDKRIETQTNENGEYVVALSPQSENYTIWVEKLGVSSPKNSITVRRGENHTVNFEISLIACYGMVIDKGYENIATMGAISGVRVSCVTGDSSTVSTTTDDDGRFELLIPQKYAGKNVRILIQHDDYDAVSYPLSVPTAGQIRLPPDESEACIALTPSCEKVIFDVLEEGTEQPVLDAKVTILDKDGKPLPDCDGVSVESDGGFCAIIPHGHYTLSVSAPGYRKKETALELFKGDGFSEYQNLRPFGQFTVRVTDVRGNLLSDARFEIKNGNGESVDFTQSDCDSGITGEYTLEARPGEYSLTVRRSGYADKTIPVTVTKGKDNTRIFVKMDSATEGTITAWVTDADGKLLTNVQFTLTDEDGNAVQLPWPVSYTSEGYVLTVAAGTYNVTARADGCGEKTVSVTVHSQQNTSVRMKLEAEGTITVTVKAEEGGALTDASFVLANAGGSAVEFTRSTDGLPAGQYRLTTVPGSYTLTVRREGYAEKRVSVTVTAGQNATATAVLHELETYENLILTYNSETDSYTVSRFTGEPTVVRIPSTYENKPVREIGPSAFEKCVSMTRLVIPRSVTVIHQYAFVDCDGLTSITVPGNVLDIGYGVFCACTALKSVVIEDGVKTLSRLSFANCQNLTSVTIPDSVTAIHGYAFRYSDNVQTVYVKEGSYAEDWAKSRWGADKVFYY